MTLAVALVGLMPWITPGPPNAARAASSVCGRQWGSAVQLANLPGNLLEVSGFVSSAKYPGVAWMIRDSDNPESLYSFQLDGNQPRWQEFKVSGTTNNVDWEDIAYTVGPDGRGRLWILENGIETGPKKIYEVLEPDPFTDQTAQVAATYRVEYPGTNRNTESMFAVGGRLAVVTKSDPNRLYTLPSTLSRTSTNRLSDAGRLDVDSWVTTVQVSGDEQLLMAVSTEDEVTVIENSRPGDITAFSSDQIFTKSMPETQREAGDFFPHDACDIVMVSEDATVWRMSGSPPPGPIGEPIVPFGSPPPEAVTPVAPMPPPEPPPAVRQPGGVSGNGYWMLASDGAVYTFGDAAEPRPRVS